MFYKPKFCCNCGEKIERTEWPLLASRRFCEFCQIEQKQHDLLVKGFVSFCLIFGILGVTGFFDSSKPTDFEPNQIQAVSKNLKPASAQPSVSAADAANVAADAKAGRAKAGLSNTAASGRLSEQRGEREKPSEPAYYCGAITKKGTPCTRRVRSIGRCWQHTGRPADPTFSKTE